MADVTVIVPIAPHHVFLASRAIAAARTQTVACEVLPIVDEERRGPGWARNIGLAQASGEYVVFLDADDLISPDFVERCLTVARQTGRYVYTDWQDEDGNFHVAPACAWVDHTWHVVTCLVPTLWARAIGGFDETIPGGEDTEFYTHLTSAGYCGIRLPAPLFTYGKNGRRSAAWRGSAAFDDVMRLIVQRYKGAVMGCCGSPDSPTPTMGMVHVRPKWGGRRSERGSVSGKFYPRVDRNTVIEIDIRDARARPDLWNVVDEPADHTIYITPTDDFNTLAGFAQEAVAAAAPATATRREPPPSAPPVPSVPNIAKLVRAGRRAFGMSKQPTFVFPDTAYPSYTDFRRLVRLSGFDTCAFAEMNWHDPAETYVIVTPEALPAPKSQTAAKVIAWVMEYAGDYEPNLSDWQSDVWASDPGWAAAHRAQFVPLGSHSLLNYVPDDMPPKKYDLALVGYMVPRRIALKDQLPDLRWAETEYPGYGMTRHDMLTRTQLMLHVHQHDGGGSLAPLRIALAAAYRMPVVSEAVLDPGIYRDYVRFAMYGALPRAVRDELAGVGSEPDRVDRSVALHNWLCYDMTFERAVREALR